MFRFDKQRLYIISTIPSKSDPSIPLFKSKLGINCTFDLGNPSFVPKSGVPYAVFELKDESVVRVVTERIDYDLEDPLILDFIESLGYMKFKVMMEKVESYVSSNMVTIDEIPDWIRILKNLITKDLELPVNFAGHIYYFGDTFKFIRS